MQLFVYRENSMRASRPSTLLEESDCFLKTKAWEQVKSTNQVVQLEYGQQDGKDNKKHDRRHNDDE